MAITVYPLNDIDFTAEDVAIYNATRTSGIYAGDDFAISLTGADNTISIDVGLAWMHLSRFNGVAVALKSKTFVDMGLPNAIYPRIDALVLQFDANQNGATLVSKQGAASSNPQPPAVSRAEALYELHLLHVLRTPGAAYISAGDVTDLRLDANYCGLMADAVTRVDTAAINAQVTALIQKLRDDLADVEAQDYYASKDYVDRTKVDKANVVNNFTTTEEGFVADARALKILNDSKLSMELLWQNASPTSALSGLLAFDWKDYDLLYGEATGTSGSSATIILFPGDSACFFTVDSNNYICIRALLANSEKTGVTLYGGGNYRGTLTLTIDNTILIPQKFYGIKGVTG